MATNPQAEDNELVGQIQPRGHILPTPDKEDNEGSTRSKQQTSQSGWQIGSLPTVVNE